MPKIVDDKLMTAVLNYLASRPYSEVAQGIAGLMQAPEVVLPDDPTFAEFYKTLAEKVAR